MKPLNVHEKIGQLIPVQKSDFFKDQKGFVIITTHRLILLTEDKSGGSYWPLGSTDFVSKKGKPSIHPDFSFKSTLEKSKEHWIRLNNKSERKMVKTLFLTSKEFKEYTLEEDDYLKYTDDDANVSRYEATIVRRFSQSLKVCSENADALFKWLLLMVGLLVITLSLHV